MGSCDENGALVWLAPHLIGAPVRLTPPCSRYADGARARVCRPDVRSSRRASTQFGRGGGRWPLLAVDPRPRTHGEYARAASCVQNLYLYLWACVVTHRTRHAGRQVGTRCEGEYLPPSEYAVAQLSALAAELSECAIGDTECTDALAEQKAGKVAHRAKDVCCPLSGPSLKLVVERAAPHVIVGVHVFGVSALRCTHRPQCTTLVTLRVRTRGSCGACRRLPDSLAVLHSAVPSRSTITVSPATLVPQEDACELIHFGTTLVQVDTQCIRMRESAGVRALACTLPGAILVA